MLPSSISLVFSSTKRQNNKENIYRQNKSAHRDIKKRYLLTIFHEIIGGYWLQIFNEKFMVGPDGIRFGGGWWRWFRRRSRSRREKKEAGGETSCAGLGWCRRSRISLFFLIVLLIVRVRRRNWVLWFSFGDWAMELGMTIFCLGFGFGAFFFFCSARKILS